MKLRLSLLCALALSWTAPLFAAGESGVYVHPSTGAIVRPVTASTFRSANSIQPLDAELTAIAGLTSASDKGFYFTGSGTAAVFDLTSFSRTALGRSTAALWRTDLGLVINTDVQAWDADLDDLADGALTGSKVGSGIAAGNITTGTLDTARLHASGPWAAKSAVANEAARLALTGKKIGHLAEQADRPGIIYRLEVDGGESTAANWTNLTGAMVKIADVLTGYGSSYTLSSIPQGFRHLKIIGRVRHYGATFNYFQMRLNGVSSGYTAAFAYLINTGTVGAADPGTDGLPLCQDAAEFESLLMNYSEGTSPVKCLGHAVTSGGTKLELAGAGPATAVTSITFRYSSGQDFGDNGSETTRLEIYGIL